MSRKSKGTFTCKIVAQNERGMLGQVRDSVYRGVKYCGEDGQVEKTFCFPRKLAEDEAARIVAAARKEAAALLNDAEARKAELVTEIADKEVRHGYRGHINEDSDRAERALQQACEGDRQVEELLREQSPARGYRPF